MSDNSDNQDERGRSLLSLASWREPEARSHRPEPEESPLLAGLARAPEPAAWQPAPDTRHSEPSAPSIADLLRRRSRELADRPAIQPDEDVADARPVEEPRSKRLDIPRVDLANRTPPRGRERASAAPPASGRVDKPGKGKSGSAPKGGGGSGVIATLMAMIRRPAKAAPAAGKAPAPPPRSARLRLPRKAPDRPSAVPEGAPAAPAAALEVPRNRSPRDWSPNRSPQAMREAAHHERMPAFAPSPAPAQPPVYAASIPAAPAWPPAAPMQPSAPFLFPSMPAPMMQPASAHFYWPQPVQPLPAAWPPPVSVPPAPASLSPTAAAVHAPSPQAPGPTQPAAANDAPPYPVHAPPASDPLTAEIDEVRERLRAFGESLRELRRTRSARHIG